ncbi:sugar ABC transporter permease [Microbacterium sp. zg-Y818]|uniref:carbohydrate ABC transporter permease n=1 Tax=unclassified Microbacterium TaxID=2609290 RepID=UPI00214AEC12|nr:MULTISPECIES: sugar ABC transporter permease [unclassified Microbacterium]MCR2799497.1 sugar ABC transporter permease [Microbacterium sp. zg.Y818]WIM21494.1 sugar ABC transporter permease [Microbacterium sp. zg-Y818]
MTVATGVRPKSARRTPRWVAPYVFLLPAGLLFVLFLAVPIAYAIFLSFRGLRVTGVGPFGVREETWVGLDNYARTFTDPQFLAGFGRLAVYGLIAVPLTLGLALLFALLLDLPGVRAARFSRTAIFIPYAVPGVIASLLWGFLYLPSTSPLNWILNQFGLPDLIVLSGSSLFPAVANIAIWGGIGFNMIIIYTSLRGIPSEIYEAARIDGASEWQIAWRIKIPLVSPALVLTGLFALIGTLQVYGEPQTLRPMTNEISQTWVPLMKIYRDAFTRDDLSLAAASSVVLALGTLLLSIILLRATQKSAFGGSE